MNPLKFNCPQCGQRLAVDPAESGNVVACSQCGQAITVPRLAQMAAKVESPKQMKWWWLAGGIALLAVVGAVILIWHVQRLPAIQAASAPVVEDAAPTPAVLRGKHFRFSWRTKNEQGDHGILIFRNDGTLSGGAPSPNESFWSIDGKGQLIFKHRNGRISTIFTNAEQRDGKWFFSGAFQFSPGVEHLLAEVSPQGAGNAPAQGAAMNRPRPTAEQQLKARRVRALTDALRTFGNNDPQTAELISNILARVNQPGGLTTNELADGIARMKNRVSRFVRRGDMESASALNHAQIMTFYTYDFPRQPAHPHQKVGRSSGPGGLVLYLSFDKPDANGVVHDESGAGNDGQVFGAQWVPDGKFGGGYRFSITNFDDRIVIPNSDSLNAEDITLTAWIKAPANTGCYERIFDKDFHHGFALSLGGDWQNQGDRGKLLWETGNGVVTGLRADDNQWHHVAAAYDGQTVRCYVDGVESGHGARVRGPLSQSGWDLCIGNSVVDYGWGELMAFDGLIDEVRVYNRALSAAEIKTLATATQAGVGVAAAR